MQSRKEEIYNEEQSFGNLNHKISKIMENTRNDPNLFSDSGE